MKKHLHFAFVFLVLLVTSCATDKLEVSESNNTNPENIWAYDGDNTTIIAVIKELKGGTNRISLERRLLKNDVLWENAEPLIIEDKKRILVPFLSVNKDNVIGILSLVKDADGKTTFDMVVRKDLMNKSAKLPFWKRSLWAGYFKALDKDILGIKNGSPGLVEKQVKNRNSLTIRMECGNVPVTEICITYSECDSYDGGETWTNCIDLYTDCYYEYEWQCWEVPDDCPAGYEMDANGNCVPITCPSGYEMDANGNCVAINQTCPSGYEMDANGSCVPINQCDNTDLSSTLYNQVDTIEFIGSTFTSKNSNITSKSLDSNTTSKNLKWRLKVGPETYVISTEEGVLKSVNNPSHPYEWQSLTHKTLSVDSAEIVVAITVEDHTGVETLGLYNSIMDLSFDLKASLICRGTPFADNKSYTGRKIFTTADFGID